MKCKSCDEVVSAKFAHAISVNSCPFCGKNIIEDGLCKVLQNLKDVMKEAEPYMSEVKDWLRTNFSLGEVNKQIKDTSIIDDVFDEDDIQKQTALAKQNLSGFQARAGIKPKSLKSIVSQIKGDGAADPSEFVGRDPDYGDIDMSGEASMPLNDNDLEDMGNILDAKYRIEENNIKQQLEIDKLKRLQTGGKMPGGGAEKYRFNRD